MTAFSQPERSGLERQQRVHTALTHPDADLLAAFSEHTLTTRERELVVDHLAECASCREVVALALPQIEEAAVPQVVPKRSPVWEWPMFRWGALAASLAIVTVAVYVGTTNKQPAVNPLTSDKAPLGAPALEQKVQRDDTATQLPSSPGLKAPQVRYEKMPTPPAATRSLSDQPKDKAQRSPAILAKADKLNEARAIGGLVTIAPGAINEPSTPSKAEASMRIDNLSANEAQADAKELRAQAPPPPPPPPVNGALMARTEAANSVSQSVQVSAEGGPVQDQRSLDAASGQFDKSTRAKVAPTFKTSASSALSGYQPFANLPGLRWHVTPEGRLQHADEKGNWNDQLPALRFTAVDTFGEHIWAFGPQLLLMHSSDNGLHWARVVPHTEDSSPQGDIISLNFTDQGHGSFKTSSGETWSTADSGKTWKKE